MHKPAWIQYRALHAHGRLHQLSHAALELLRELAWREGIHPTAQRRGTWATVEELAESRGYSRRSMQYATRELTAAGLIDADLTAGRGRRNILTVRLTVRAARRALRTWTSRMRRLVRKGAEKVQRGQRPPLLKQKKHRSEGSRPPEPERREGRPMRLGDIIAMATKTARPEALTGDGERSAAGGGGLNRKTDAEPPAYRRLCPDGWGERAFEGGAAR